MTKEQFGKAYEEGREYTIRFLLARGVRRDVALDVAQGAWVRGWERLEQLRDESVLTAWVNTIALNDFRKTLRHERLREALLDAPDPKSDVNMAALDLSRIMSRCQSRDRALLDAQLQGVTAKDLSRRAGTTATAMRLRLFRARTAARNAAISFRSDSGPTADLRSPAAA